MRYIIHPTKSIKEKKKIKVVFPPKLFDNSANNSNSFFFRSNEHLIPIELPMKIGEIEREILDE